MVGAPMHVCMEMCVCVCHTAGENIWEISLHFFHRKRHGKSYWQD